MPINDISDEDKTFLEDFLTTTVNEYGVSARVKESNKDLIQKYKAKAGEIPRTASRSSPPRTPPQVGCRR